MWHVSDRSHHSSASDEHKMSGQKTEAFLPHQKASKLRFVSSVEYRHSSGETSTTPLSPGSPAEESSGELGGRNDKPRLQRSKAQSRKTFRLRKSRKSPFGVPSRAHPQVSHIRLEPQELPAVGVPRQPLELCVAGIPPAPASAPPCTSHAPQQLPTPPPQQHPSPALSVFATPGGVAAARAGFCRRARSVDSAGGGHDPSWDEVSQTSSTSGYRESYTMLATTLESPPMPGAGMLIATEHHRRIPPPLASPDLPSSSSAATNCPLAEGSSPDSSIRSPRGEEVALLSSSRDHSASQHSLLMMFDTQDEDTLI